MNNPLKFTDPNGEFLHIIIGAIIGGAANVIYKACTGQLHSWKDGFVAFGIGAGAGAAGAATGGIAFAAAGGAAGGMGGFLAGTAAGAASSAIMTPVQSYGNHLYFGDPMISMKDYAMGIGMGALAGGAVNGGIAAIKGNNFWNGKDIAFGRSTFSINNTPTKVAPEMSEIPGKPVSVDVPANNPVPEKVTRVVASQYENSSTLGPPNSDRVFVTAAEDIEGLTNPAQIVERLAIDPSPSFTVIEFDVPKTGIATPIKFLDTRFLGKGLTLGGAREFTIPNQAIPKGNGVRIFHIKF